MDEVLRLASQKNIQARDVEKVEVGGNAGNVTTLFRHRPTTGLEGKFSMEFVVSILLLDRKAGLSQFSDAVVQRPDVQEMIRRVTFYVDPDFNKDGNFALKFTMKDGRVLSTRTGPAKGSPKNPMTYEEVADKLRGCAEFAKWPTQKAEQVIELVQSLERAPDVSRLTAALTG
jgi:2-methylcitrate dehydratase PrpD